MHNPVQLFHLKPRSINIQYGFFLNTFNSDGNKTQDNTCRHLKKKPKKVFSYSIMPFTQIFEEKKKTQPSRSVIIYCLSILVMTEIKISNKTFNEILKDLKVVKL